MSLKKLAKEIARNGTPEQQQQFESNLQFRIACLKSSMWLTDGDDDLIKLINAKAAYRAYQKELQKKHPI